VIEVLNSFWALGTRGIVLKVTWVLYINSLRPSVRDGARVSRRPGPAHLVLRVFFQKICGFWAEISCSQSFLSKDLWFLGRNFLFPEFSFKRSVVSELSVQVDWAWLVGRNFLFPEFLFKRSMLCSYNSRTSSPSTGSTAIYVLSIFTCTT
jgi:hypothetical protein